MIHPAENDVRFETSSKEQKSARIAANWYAGCALTDLDTIFETLERDVAESRSNKVLREPSGE